MDHLADHRTRWRTAGLYTSERLSDAMDSVTAAAPSTTLTLADAASEVSVTFAELQSSGLVFARAAKALGLGRGDVVAVQLPDSIEGLIAYRGIMLLGAVLVPIPMIYQDKEVSFILRDCRAKAVIGVDSWRSVAYGDTLARIATVVGVDVNIVVGSALGDEAVEWSDLMARGDAPGSTDPVENTADPSDDAVIIYTSGSTADPKGARHSHESFLFELRQAVQSWEGEDRWLSAFPFGHMAGLLEAFRPLVLGGDMVVLDRWDAARAVQLIAKYELTTANLGPYHLLTLLEECRSTGHDIGLKNCFVGSAAVQPALILDADALGCPAYRMYGSSEHPTISSGNPADDAQARARSDGRLLDHVEVRIVDQEDRDVAPGVEGHILSRGPDLFLGYTNVAATAEALDEHGYYRTGDLGTLVDGVLTITGRHKDIIIRGGENLSPKEIEDVLITHPSVLEVAVVGAPDPKLGERPWAYVITRDGATVYLPDLIEHCRRAGMAKQKMPEGLTLVEEFPRTAAGKIRKRDLRGMLGAGG